MEAEEKDVEMATRFFQNLEADAGQARVMAIQLLKRASQLAEKRQISKLEATETLLRQVVEARQGIAPGSNTAEND